MLLLQYSSPQVVSSLLVNRIHHQACIAMMYCAQLLGARRVHRTRSGHASKHSVGPINTVVTRWHRSVYPATVSMLPKADPLAQRASSKVLQPTEADSRNALCPRRWSIIHTPNQSLIIACRESVTNQINYYLPSPFRATQVWVREAHYSAPDANRRVDKVRPFAPKHHRSARTDTRSDTSVDSLCHVKHRALAVWLT